MFLKPVLCSAIKHLAHVNSFRVAVEGHGSEAHVLSTHRWVRQVERDEQSLDGQQLCRKKQKQ